MARNNRLAATNPIAVAPRVPPPTWALPPYFNDSSELIIRHLPENYDLSGVTEFLQGLGGRNIRYFGSTGRLRNIAIADFETPSKAIMVLQKLHQIRLGKQRLVVEFATEIIKRHHPIHETVSADATPSGDSVLPPSLIPYDLQVQLRDLMAISPSTGINFPINPQLKYKYPSATPSILTNIMYAMASDSRLYVQVLHLMNKLNLPVPFGPVGKTPKMFRDNRVNVESEDAGASSESSSENGSEIESSLESDKLCKQPEPKLNFGSALRKKRKICLPSITESTGNTPETIPITDVFGECQIRQKPRLHIITPSSEIQSCSSSEVVATLSESGFGTFSNIAIEKTTTLKENAGFITKDRLASNRISAEEMASSTVFKNYSPGNPSAKLYLKNLAKVVDEEHLRYIFGRYVNWESPREVESFQIRVMQEGRMKGQAFVTLPSQMKAMEAVEDINGYILEGKALCVCFARSKEETK